MQNKKNYGKTPNGGDYFIALYLNEKGEDVDPDEATKIIIQEYTKDDKLIQETIGFTKKSI